MNSYAANRLRSAAGNLSADLKDAWPQGPLSGWVKTMIAARLKHIFFTLLFTEILSLTISFVVSCQQLHRLSSGELTLNQFSSNLVFYLVPAYIFSLLGVLLIFYRELTRFSGFHLSLTRMLFFKAMAVLIGFSLWFLVQSWLASSPTATLLIWNSPRRR